MRILGCVLYPRFGFGLGLGLGSVGAGFPRQRLFGARRYREGCRRWRVERTRILFNVNHELNDDYIYKSCACAVCFFYFAITFRFSNALLCSSHRSWLSVGRDALLLSRLTRTVQVTSRCNIIDTTIRMLGIPIVSYALFFPYTQDNWWIHEAFL